MINDNILIDDNDIAFAKEICNDIVNKKERSRSVANVLVAKLAKKYFSEEIDTTSGIHNFSSVLQFYDISDVYLRENYIDVRLYFNNESIVIPKKHFDINVLPLAYMFIKVDENLSSGTVQGFIFPSDMNIENTEHDDEYYYINESDLLSYYDLQERLITLDYIEPPENFNKTIYDYLDGREVDLQLFFNILTHSSGARQMFANIATSYSVLKFISINEENAELDIDSNINNESDDILLESSLDENSIIDDINTDIQDENELKYLDEYDDSLEDNILQSFEDNNELIQDDLQEFISDDIILNDDMEDGFEKINDDITLVHEEPQNVPIDNTEFELSELESDITNNNLKIQDMETVDINDINDVDNSDDLDLLINNDKETFVGAVDETTAIEDLLQKDDNFSQSIVDESKVEESMISTIDDEKQFTKISNISENNDEIIKNNSDIVYEENELTDSNDDEQLPEFNSIEQINTLFNYESEQNNDEKDEQLVIEKKKRKLTIPILSTLLIVSALGYHLYSKFNTQQIPDENITEKTELPTKVTEKLANSPIKTKSEDVAMPNETVENNPVLNSPAKNEAIPVSIPVIEKNLDASVLVTNLSINWSLPSNFVSNNAAKRYFIKIGKILQLNLKTELLLMSTPPITNKIEVELEFNQTNKKFIVKNIITSSGEKRVDEIIKKTVSQVLNLNLNMNMSVFNSLQGNPVLVIKL